MENEDIKNFIQKYLNELLKTKEEREYYLNKLKKIINI